MRSLRIVGLDESGTFVVCEDSQGQRFKIEADDHLRAAARGDIVRLGQIENEQEKTLRPREIQARIRGGESVENLAFTESIPMQRVERFAHPVLLERARTADLAKQAHPIREDGPDVQTLVEVAAYSFQHWGQDFEATSWDSWRGDDGRWVVQLRWNAGRSENRAHWAFSPGANGGTVVALDERAEHVLDPQSQRGPRALGAAKQPKQEEPEFLVKNTAEDFPEDESVESGQLEPIPAGDPSLAPPVELVTTEDESTIAVEGSSATEPEQQTVELDPEPESSNRSVPAKNAKAKSNRPAVPAWEDVLLGVRSNR